MSNFDKETIGATRFLGYYPPPRQVNFEPPKEYPRSPGRPWSITIFNGEKRTVIRSKFKYYKNANARAQKIFRSLRRKGKRVQLEHRKNGVLTIYQDPSR